MPGRERIFVANYDDATTDAVRVPLEILRNVRKAINPGGRLLLMEFIPPAGDIPHQAKVFDLWLLLLRLGRGAEARPDRPGDPHLLAAGPDLVPLRRLVAARTRPAR